MKAIRSYRFIPMVLVFLFAGTIVLSQDKESELERQKAMQAEEMKMRKEMLEEQQEKMKEMERQRADQLRVMESHAKETARSREFFSSGRASDKPYYISFTEQSTQSQLTLRKTFREVTSTSGGEFEVEPDIHHFRCMISASVKSGEIFIGIEYPDGKIFKELVINSSADINFSQSISIKEGEGKKYSGTWYYVIKADKAEGNYMVQIQTN